MTFHLQIVTPDGLFFEGEAEKLSVRTQDGIIGILPRHIDYVAPLGMGEAVVTVDGKERRAACIGGMVAVQSGEVRLVATTFEWAEKIDLERAKNAENRARAVMAREGLSKRDLKVAEARLHRALVRQAVGGR
jgi:F-type H+-transporting ATPase subunit epsilon